MSSPDNFHGVVYGAKLSVNGHEGKAYHFDGSSYIKVPGFDICPDTHRRLTMGAWVKPDNYIAHNSSDAPRYVSCSLLGP